MRRAPFLALVCLAGALGASGAAGSADRRYVAPSAQRPPPVGFAGVLGWHNDLARTGQNRSETALTTANVSAASFGKVFARPVDGIVYAQPLYVPRLALPGGVHNVVYVATEHDSVYAFDADGLSSLPLWHVSFIDPGHGITTMPCTNGNQPECDPTIMTPERGITATPAIDPGRATMYVVAKTVEHGTFFERLHALDIRTGAERAGSPIAVAASAPGHPNIRFSGTAAFSRSGVVLAGGIVYLAFASNDDANGWLIGYDAATLAQAVVFCVTPTGSLGAIWGGGAAPALDAAGSIYFMTGNGTFDAQNGGLDYGMSMVHLTTAGGVATIADYFTPFNELRLSRHDLDLASGGVMLLPDQPGPHPHEVVGAFKTGQIFLVDRDNMGKFNPQNNHQIVETVVGNPSGGYYSSPAYWGGAVYYAGVSAPLARYALSSGRLSQKPVSQSAAAFNYPGATPSVSSNGATNGIVWAIAVSGRPQGGPPAVLHAYDARNLTHELYNSNQAGLRDRAGAGTKFSVPTVANGRVYIGTQTELDAYGLLH
jgi:hypothetical protein